MNKTRFSEGHSTNFDTDHSIPPNISLMSLKPLRLRSLHFDTLSRAFGIPTSFLRMLSEGETVLLKDQVVSDQRPKDTIRKAHSITQETTEANFPSNPVPPKSHAHVTPFHYDHRLRKGLTTNSSLHPRTQAPRNQVSQHRDRSSRFLHWPSNLNSVSATGEPRPHRH